MRDHGTLSLKGRSPSILPLCGLGNLEEEEAKIVLNRRVWGHQENKIFRINVSKAHRYSQSLGRHPHTWCTRFSVYTLHLPVYWDFGGIPECEDGCAPILLSSHWLISFCLFCSILMWLFLFNFHIILVVINDVTLLSLRSLFLPFWETEREWIQEERNVGRKWEK